MQNLNKCLIHSDCRTSSSNARQSAIIQTNSTDPTHQEFKTGHCYFTDVVNKLG